MRKASLGTSAHQVDKRGSGIQPKQSMSYFSFWVLILSNNRVPSLPRGGEVTRAVLKGEAATEGMGL
jgi:hypothetical protein